MLELLLSLVSTTLPALPQEPADSSQPNREIPPGRLVVVGQFDASITVVDPRGGEVLARIDAGLRPDEVVASPDGRRAYVMVYGSQIAGQRIAELKLDGEPRLGEIHDLPGLARPHGCEWVGDHLWFTAEVNSCVARFNPATGAVDAVLGHGGALGHMLAFDEVHERIFVANVASQDCSVIPLRGTNEGVKRIALPAPQPEGLACSPDGSEVWFAHRQDGLLSVLDTTTLEVAGTVEVGGLPFRLAFNREGRLYVSDPVGQTLVEVDPSKREVVRRIELGGAGSGFVLHDSGEWAAISMPNEDEAAIVHLASGDVVRRIPVGDHPDGICWAAPAGSTPQLRPLAERAGGFLGVIARFVPRERRKALGADFEGGVLVHGLHQAGGAVAAGLEEGDILISLDGVPIEGTKHFQALLGGRKAGEVLLVGLIQAGGEARTEKEVRLSDRPLW